MLSESTEQQNSTDFSEHRKYQNLAALQIYLDFIIKKIKVQCANAQICRFINLQLLHLQHISNYNFIDPIEQ